MADVWSEIGGLELRLGRPEAAVSAYKHLVEVAPHDPAALINVADTLILLGRLDEAEAQAKVGRRVGLHHRPAVARQGRLDARDDCDGADDDTRARGRGHARGTS